MSGTTRRRVPACERQFAVRAVNPEALAPVPGDPRYRALGRLIVEYLRRHPAVAADLGLSPLAAESDQTWQPAKKGGEREC